MTEKLDLIQEHNAKIEILVNENKYLRASLNPSDEKQMADERRLDLIKQVSMEHNNTLREENNVLRAEISRLKDELSRYQASGYDIK